MSVEGQNTDTEAKEEVIVNTSEQEAGSNNGGYKATQEDVLAFLKENGREVSSIEDLFKVPEPIIETKEVNPYEGLMDDDDKAFFNYKKETGRTRKEYEALQTNLDDVSPLQFAREQVLKETGMKLSKEEIDEYLEEKLSISDLRELSTKDTIELMKYGKSIKDARIEEQAKYRQPVEKKEVVQTQNNQNQDEYVQLANGTYMKKTDFEVAQQNQIKHNQMTQEAVNSVAATSFSVMIDDNGEQKELKYEYDYSDDDRSSAMSIVSDIGKFVQDTYETAEGFNHKQFAEDTFWLIHKNRATVISSIVHKARAQAIEEVLKDRGNTNYQSQSSNLSSKEKPGIKIMNINDI